jgi:acetoin:2,6-dichlorophenolindophenol oxidoreductase subunit alpha
MVVEIMGASPSPAGETVGISQELFTKTYRFMLQARVLEEKLASLYRAGMIKGGVFLGRGQEALSASVGVHLRPGDIFAPLIRDQAGRMAFGDTALDTFRTYLGSQLGSMRGRDGNIHRGRPTEGYYAMISHLGAMIPVVVGALMARRFRGETGVVGATCIGDGGTSTGAFHEGLNMAAVEKVPLVLVIANNQYAYSTPNSRQYACASLADKAAGYGVPVHEVDGVSLDDCLSKIGSAVQDARSGGGPQLVIGQVLRLVGHGEHDDFSYLDPRFKQQPFGRDCLEVAEALLVDRDWASPEEIASWRQEYTAEFDSIASRVQREPAPHPKDEDWSAMSRKCLLDQESNLLSA